MHHRERGSAVNLAIMMVLFFMVIVGFLLDFSTHRDRALSERTQSWTLRADAESALAFAIARIMKFDERSLVGTFADGTSWCAVVRPSPNGNLYKITVAAASGASAGYTDTATYAACEAVVQRVIPVASQRTFFGTVMAKMALTTGAGTVTGDNVDLTLTNVGLGVGTGRYSAPQYDTAGLISRKGITVAALLTLTGCGTTPGSKQHVKYPGPDGSYPTYDNGQNCYINATAQWGITATNHFPTTLEGALFQADGRLKTVATMKGTHFTSVAAYKAWLMGLPNLTVPPNQIIYLDYSSLAADYAGFPNVAWSQSWHIVVNHAPYFNEVNYSFAGETMTAYLDTNPQDGIPDTVADPAWSTAPWTIGTALRVVGGSSGYVKTEPDGTSVIVAPTSTFYGLFVVDSIATWVATSDIYGGLLILGHDSGVALNVCTTSAHLTYSSYAMDQAIAALGLSSATSKVESYREDPASINSRDLQLSLQQIGITTYNPASPADAVSVTTPTATIDGWFEPRSATVAASTVS